MKTQVYSVSLSLTKKNKVLQIHSVLEESSPKAAIKQALSNNVHQTKGYELSTTSVVQVSNH